MSLNRILPGLRPSARHLSSSSSRSFSTTPAILSTKVPPESPSFIRLPPPPQSQDSETKKPRVRGILPVPREVFPRYQGDRKTRPEYIEKTAPRPATDREPSTASQRWRRDMAESRRSNLTEGLRALYVRRNQKDAVRRRSVGRNFRLNNEAAAAPEREVDRLTRGTVLDAVLDMKVYPDPDAAARVERGKAKVAARQAAKHEARRDALMELYINASNFIVKESELREEIDRIFTEDYFRKESLAEDRMGATENVWGVYGKPPSIADMVATTTGTSTRVMDFYETELDRSAKRQKRIAEELTGGKME